MALTIVDFKLVCFVLMCASCVPIMCNYCRVFVCLFFVVVTLFMSTLVLIGFNLLIDMDITEELRKSAAEDNMERQWMKINAIGSPELLLHWPRTSKKLGAIGQQQVSVVSPGEVDLLQTEYPDYPKPKAMGTDVPGIIRSRVSEKRKGATLNKVKQ